MLMPVKKMMNFAPLTCNLGSEDSLNMRNASLIQRGFTLVELMVAMAIGLFIVLIAITIYTQGLSSVAFRMGQSENLNNSRYTIGIKGAKKWIREKKYYRTQSSQENYMHTRCHSSHKYKISFLILVQHLLCGYWTFTTITQRPLSLISSTTPSL